MIAGLQFDADKHLYTLDGVELPSVTQILEDVGLVDYDDVPRRILARKAHLGTLVHQSCELLDDGDLDMANLPEPVQPYVFAYEAFKRQSGFEPAILERRMVGQVNGMKYGMTPDRVGLLNGCPYVLDLKTACQKQRSWGVQLAGYAMGLPRPKVGARYSRGVIHLLPNGEYKLLTLTDSTDEQVFQWALALTWWKRNSGY